MRSGYVLLCSADGPGVSRRLHDEQRHSWTFSSFFFRVPRRVSTWLPQSRHASGGLEVSGTRATRGREGLREGYASR